MLINPLILSILGYGTGAQPPPFADLVDFDKQTEGLIFAHDPVMQLVNMFERDLLFVNYLKNAPGKKIVGIFGLSHIHGILKSWNESAVDVNLLLTKDKGFMESAALFDKVFPAPTSDESDAAKSNKTD